MARTLLNSDGVQTGAILRAHLNTSLAGSCVIAKVIAGSGIAITNTGADAGTGDVTISATATPATVAPVMDGTAAVGVSALYARQDHVHPSNTSLAPLASPTFTGAPTAPTPAAGDASSTIATTAYVQNVNSICDVGFGAGNVTLTQASAGYRILYFYGQAAPQTLTMPVAGVPRYWMAMNPGSYPITLVGTSGGTIVVAPGAFRWVWTDGAGIYDAITATGNLTVNGALTPGSIAVAPILTALEGASAAQLQALASAIFAALPTALPASDGLAWNDSGGISFSGEFTSTGAASSDAFTALLAAAATATPAELQAFATLLFNALGTSQPAAAGLPWNDGGAISLSQP